MSCLYFVCDTHKIVWTYAPVAEGQWRFARMSPCQREKNAFVLLFKPKETLGWAVQNQTPGHGEIIGTPLLPVEQQSSQQPPLARWWMWGNPYRLFDQTPRAPPPLSRQTVLDLPFGVLDYREEFNIARVHVTMRNVTITDEDLETAMSWFAQVLRNLAQRVTMSLLIKSVVSEAKIPSVSHIRRFLAFMQDMGPEIVLCGRGSVYIVQASGFLGKAKLGVIRWVQQRLPAPWPEDIVASSEAADRFLANIAARIRESTTASSEQALPPATATSDTAASSGRPQVADQTGLSLSEEPDQVPAARAELVSEGAPSGPDKGTASPSTDDCSTARAPATALLVATAAGTATTGRQDESGSATETGSGVMANIHHGTVDVGMEVFEQDPSTRGVGGEDIVEPVEVVPNRHNPCSCLCKWPKGDQRLALGQNIRL